MTEYLVHGHYAAVRFESRNTRPNAQQDRTGICSVLLGSVSMKMASTPINFGVVRSIRLCVCVCVCVAYCNHGDQRRLLMATPRKRLMLSVDEALCDDRSSVSALDVAMFYSHRLATSHWHNGDSSRLKIRGILSPFCHNAYTSASQHHVVITFPYGWQSGSLEYKFTRRPTKVGQCEARRHSSHSDCRL